MLYEIRRSLLAKKDIRAFARYLRREAGVAVAQHYIEALEYDIEHFQDNPDRVRGGKFPQNDDPKFPETALTRVIAENPGTFSWFHETGTPYRAKLFKLSPTTYWIIYTIDDEQHAVEINRFWNAAREPHTHGL